MFEVISKQDAKAKGLMYYFTGIPCRAGGIGRRLVNGGGCCCDLCKKKRSIYTAQHRASNKEKYRVWNKRYREANAAEVSQFKKQWYRSNREYVRAKHAEYYRENTELFRDLGRRYTAKKRSRMPIWFGELDEFVIQEAFGLAKLRKECTGLDWHVDHMVPLNCRTASGLHCASNMQVIPRSINCRKKNRLVLISSGEWILHL